MRTIFMALAICCVNLPFMLIKCAPFELEMDRKTRVKVAVLYALMILATVGVTIVFDRTIGVTTSFYKITVLVIGSLTTLVNIIFIKKRVYEHLFVMGLSGSGVYFVYTIVTFIQVKVMDASDATFFLMINAYACAICAIPFIPLLRKLLIKTVVPFLTIESKHFWRQVWFVPEGLLLVTFLAVPTGAYISSVAALVSRLLIMGVTIAVCLSLSRENVAMRAKHASEEQLARQQEYYLALSDSMATVRKYRHDYKHHLVTLNGFAESGQFDEIRDYIKEMKVTSDRENVVPYTGRASADGLIYHYASLADQENISFTVKGTFNNIEIADTDLCALLGNALENAVAGCRTVPEGRFISIETKKQGELFAILVKNSFDGNIKEKEGIILSRKRINSRGIGLSSMEDICKKYNGTFGKKYEGNEFSVFLMLGCVK